MYEDFLGDFQVKTAVATFGQLFKEFGLISFQNLVTL